MAKKTKKKEIRRHPVGINILWGKSGVSAYQLYDISYDDGSCGIERGQSVRTLPGFEDMNGTKAQIKEASRSLRPDLEAAMQAAHILLARIGDACWDLDAPKKKGK
jgi:hypothetical protein